MKKLIAILGAVCCALATLASAGAADTRANSIPFQPIASLTTARSGWLGGDLVNLKVGPTGLALAGHDGFIRDSRAFGIYVSPPQLVDGAFDLVGGLVDLDPLGGGRVETDVRSSPDGTSWSPWEAMTADGGAVSVPPGRFFQYRLNLSGAGAEAPLLTAAHFDLASSGAPVLAVAAAENPTVRVFATREGLVGRKTANGHTIVEKDRFVALPSRKALNPDGKRDYEVRISYKGKSVTAPVWDVGPWNTRDNYWDEGRELFGDLPRFRPQALAAWKDDYNGGRDQFNRWVSFPASIDLADGTFMEDLGMRNSDWVDVTFLWVNASSPPRTEMPVVTGLKPEPKTDVPPPDGQVWYFAEGSSKPPFETSFVLQNPGAESAKAYLDYLMSDGKSERQEVTLNPGGRVTVNANQRVPNADFGTRIEATRPILAERTMYFGPDGHSTVGAVAPNTTWYLAEGSTQPPFDTWVLLLNPGSSPANVALTFMRDNGENQISNLVLEPGSRRGVRATEVVPQAAFSTKVVSDQPIVVERAVYLAEGGGHGTLATTVTSKTWYLAEGSTQDTFDTWLLLLNPGRSPAAVTVTFLRENGPPLRKRLTVGATARAAVNARQVVTGERFGIKVEADHAVVAERAIYFGGSPESGKGTGAHASAGAPEAARSWSLPDGSTQSPYSEQILVANPNGVGGHLRAEFVRPDGTTSTREYDLGPNSRLTIDVNAEVPDAALSAHLSADLPIVVERSTYFNGGSGGTSSLGIPR